MWIEIFDKNDFLKSLYRNEPGLKSLRIVSFCLSDDGLEAVLRFDLNTFPEVMPKKWTKLDFNTASIEIRFNGLKKVSLKLNEIESKSDITFSKVHLINMVISGRFEITLESERASISEVAGYQNARTNNSDS